MENIAFDGIPLGCGHLGHADPPLFVAWATEQATSCACGQPFDLWDSVLSCYSGAGATFYPQAPMGGTSLHAAITLEAGIPAIVDLAMFGLPLSATVRDIILTPQGVSSAGGFLYPAMLVDNRMRQSRLPHSFTLYPVPRGENPSVTQEISAFVQYTDTAHTPSREQLIEATAAHANQDYRKSVMEAHTAADLALETACEAKLPDLGDSDLQSMSFGAKITCLSMAAGVPIRDELRQGARDLNARRNKVAHPRRKQSELAQDEAARHLAAAVFIVNIAEQLSTST